MSLPPLQPLCPELNTPSVKTIFNCIMRDNNGIYINGVKVISWYISPSPPYKKSEGQEKQEAEFEQKLKTGKYDHLMKENT